MRMDLVGIRFSRNSSKSMEMGNTNLSERLALQIFLFFILELFISFNKLFIFYFWFFFPLFCIYFLSFFFWLIFNNVSFAEQKAKEWELKKSCILYSHFLLATAQNVMIGAVGKYAKFLIHQAEYPLIYMYIHVYRYMRDRAPFIFSYIAQYTMDY